MSRYTNIFLASVTAVVLMLGGTFWQSATDALCKSFQDSHNSLLGSIGASFSSLTHEKSTLIAAADEDSYDSKGEKKDGKDEEDGGLKELWDSVQLG